MKLKLESLDAIRMKYATEPILNGNNYVIPKSDYLNNSNNNFNYTQSNRFGSTTSHFNQNFDNSNGFNNTNNFNNKNNYNNNLNTFNNFNNNNIKNTFNPKIISNDLNNTNFSNLNQPMSQTYKNINNINLNNSNHKFFNADEYLNNFQNKMKNSQILNDSKVSGDNFIINEREYIKQSNESLNVKREYEQKLNEHLKQMNFSNPNIKYDDNENIISTSKI